MERISHNQRYSPTEASIHHVRYQFAGQFLRPGERVLDFGCGEGFGSRILAKTHPDNLIVGMDKDSAAIEIAKKKMREKNLDFVFRDLSEEAWDAEPFDNIIAIECIEHVPHLPRVIDNLKASWTRQGVFFLTIPNDFLYYGFGNSLNPFHRTAKSFFDWRAQLESEFGSALWYFGTYAQGFTIAPVAGDGAPGDTTTMELIDSASPGDACAVPGGNTPRLTPTNSLFFVAVWNAQGRSEDARTSSTLFAPAPTYRPPLPFLAPASLGHLKRRKLCLVADVRDWAYDNIAKQIKYHLGERIQIEILYQDQAASWWDTFHHAVFTKKSDFVHFFWRETLFKLLLTPWVLSGFCKEKNISPQAFAERLAETVLTASVYDHLFLAPHEINERQKYFSMLDGYSVSSRRLFEIYKDNFPVEPTVVAEDGVDLRFFRPKNLERFGAKQKRPLTIGWVGNSEWNASSGTDRKGFVTILKPAIDALKREGLRVELKLADRAVKQIPHAAMPDFYAELDVLVCTSEIEGTPNPVLEACACGVPILTTDVGIVRELLGPQQQRYVVEERSMELFKTRLAEIYRQRDHLAALSSENLQVIRAWSWDKKTLNFMRLFRQAEENNKARHFVKKELYETLIAQRFHTDWLESERKSMREKSATAVSPVEK